MFTLDKERRELLVLRKSIAQMEQAIEDMKAYADLLENALFDEYESQEIRRIV